MHYMLQVKDSDSQKQERYLNRLKESDRKLVLWRKHQKEDGIAISLVKQDIKADF